MNTNLLVAALCIGSMLGGCANQQITRTGVIQDYNALKPVSSTVRTQIKKPANGVLQKFDSIWIAPVEIRVSTPEDTKALQEVADLAANAMREAVAKDWPVVSTPGLRTLRVEAAITAVRKSSPAANVVLTIVAVPLINGGLSAEITVRDKKRKEIAAIAFADEGIFNPTGYYSEYGHPKALTADLARVLAEVLKRDRLGV